VKIQRGYGFAIAAIAAFLLLSAVGPLRSGFALAQGLAPSANKSARIGVLLYGSKDQYAPAEEGCLLGYGPDLTELRRRTADYVVRIFRGASPGELPMEQPTHFRFIVNLKTASALGLALPPSILAGADEVIE
jgi:putative ABC transport system substrate-binding protein